jgi:predicted nucleic acid-binding protein
VIVVADTSPLSYLIRSECEEALHKLYGAVVIPRAVLDELSHPKAPEHVRAWAAQPPLGLEVRSVLIIDDSELEQLGAGEGEALFLAAQVHARLLIDERRGAEVASTRGIPVTGTLGVLVAASERGYANLNDAVRRLFTKTNFRIAAAARDAFLKEHGIPTDTWNS